MTRTAYIATLILCFVIAILIRLPALFQELPPYLSCDEDIYFGEVLRMLSTNDLVATKFQSGNFNLFPALLIDLFFSHFQELSPTSVLIIGRLFYAVLLPALSIFPIAAATQKLYKNSWISLVAVGLFLTSGFALSMSRIWYPDHVLIFFSATLIWLLVVIWEKKPSTTLLCATGVTIGLAVSTKYSAIILFAPVLLIFWGVPWRFETEINGFRRLLPNRVVYKNVFIVLLSAIFVFCAINYSLFVHPDLFAKDFLFNINNYARDNVSISGVTYYLFISYVVFFGFLGIIGLISGVWQGLRRQEFNKINWILALFPLLLSFTLGFQGLVISRNMSLALPFTIPVIAFGLVAAFESLIWKKRYFLLSLFLLAIFAGTLIQIRQIVTSITNDLNEDSRVLAESWIKTHVSSTTQIGVNKVCLAPSPAQSAGNPVKEDTQFQEKLSYYVFNSYGENPFWLDNTGSRGSSQLWDLKNLHFYYLDDRNLPIEFVHMFLPPQNRNLKKVPGYELIQTFSSNGPEIYIFKKNE